MCVQTNMGQDRAFLSISGVLKLFIQKCNVFLVHYEWTVGFRKCSCMCSNHKEQYKVFGTELQSSSLCGMGMLIPKRFPYDFCFRVFELCFSSMPQTCMSSCGTTSRILNLGTRWSWAMKFCHFTAGDVASLLHCIRTWAGLTASLDMVAKKVSCSCWKSNPGRRCHRQLQWLALKGVCV